MYNYKLKTSKSFSVAESDLREALVKKGFGIITEIDVQATLKKKLGIDSEQYIILGACNPSYAREALIAEPDIGVLLPCNVIIRAEKGQIIISCVLPKVQLSKVGNEALSLLAGKVQEQLISAVDEAAGVL